METNVVNGIKPQNPVTSSSESFSSQGSNNTFLLESSPTRKSTAMPNQDPNRTQNRMFRFEFVINIINHILIGFVAIYLSWMCLRLGLKKTALHAWLCTIGFNFLMAEGVMTHYNGNALMFFYTRRTKTTVHWVLQALGGSLGIAGAIVKIAEKEIHFTTTHGKLGLAAIIICGLSMISGLSALYSQTLRRIILPVLSKGVHNFLGLGGFAIAIIAQYYGYETGFFRRKVEDDFRVMMQVITLLSLVLSLWGPLKSLWEKVFTLCRNL